MNKYAKIIFVSAIAAVAGYNTYKSQSAMGVTSDFILENVEALANDEVNSNGNTGPSELYDCPLWFTGDGTHCKCENEYSCTAVSC